MCCSCHAPSLHRAARRAVHRQPASSRYAALPQYCEAAAWLRGATEPFPLQSGSRAESLYPTGSGRTFWLCSAAVVGAAFVWWALPVLCACALVWAATWARRCFGGANVTFRAAPRGPLDC